MSGAIVALDLATRTGIAIGEPGQKPVCMTHVLGDQGGQHGDRFAAAMRLTRRLIEDHRPVELALERPIQGGGGTRHRPELLMGLRACVLGVAKLMDVPTSDHDVRSIRLHFIGHGGLKRVAAKAAVIARCRHLGYVTHGEDEADAAALWDYACSLRSRAHGIATTPLFHEAGT